MSCVTGGEWGGLRSGMEVSVSGASVLDALRDPGWSLGLGCCFRWVPLVFWAGSILFYHTKKNM